MCVLVWPAMARCNRKATEASRAVGSSSELDVNRARDRRIGVLQRCFESVFPTRPSIAQGAPLAGLGSNPAVEDHPVGQGEHRRHRDRRDRRHCRRTAALLVASVGGLLGGSRGDHFCGSMCLFFGLRSSGRVRLPR